MTKKPGVCANLILLAALPATPLSAQHVEAVGSRALAMGGAFVAVANDSSATWWNPGALAAGPFVDIGLARTVTDVTNTLPAHRDRTASFAIGTPPFGFSYYRLRITDIRPFDPTVPAGGDREDRRAEVTVRSLSVSQLGATLVHTVVPGVHIGTTLKYLRGTVLGSREDSVLDPSDLLDRGEDLGGGDTAGRFDLDVGVLAVTGPIRVGGLVKNLRAPGFGDMRLPRQVRVGAAFDAEAAGRWPLTLAIDADVKAYDAGSGDRRVIAVGAEQWLFARRLGVRAGARVNAVGAHDRAATGGVSVALRSGLYLDGHLVRGGAASERGWGLAARVTF